MSSTTLFEIPFSEFQLKNAVSSALQQSLNNPTKFSIESNLEAVVRSYMQENLKNVRLGSQCENCPPNNGLRTNFLITLQIQIDYKISFKAGVHAGLEYRFGDFYSNQSLNFSFYNSGLGTPIYHNSKEKQMVVVDATIYLGAGIGKGEADAMNQYIINYDTPIPVSNTFKNSGSYGAAFTWNSAVNQKFNLGDVQRMGVWNFRSGDFGLSTYNDSKKGYIGGGTDHGNTGGITLSFNIANWGNLELGYQNFTGKYNETGAPEQKMKYLNYLRKEKVITKDVFKQKIEELLEKSPYHSQDNYQKSLNRASNFLRFQKDKNSIRLDVESKGWFQNSIHNKIKDSQFEYDNPKPINLWKEDTF